MFATHSTRRRAGAPLVGLLVAGLLAVATPAVPAFAETPATIDFEAPAYSTGNIDGQNGWSKTGPYDVEVAAVTGGQALRISNAVTSGSFGDHAFAPLLAEEAGETDAYSPAPTATRHTTFSASWTFASVTPGAEQPGLSMTASPDRGDGGRMSYLRMSDTPTGLQVDFIDYVDAAPYGSETTPSDGYGPEDDFQTTTVASGLDRSVAHTLRIEVSLVDGPHNDVVDVYVDGAIAHTGTSWEDYFRWVQGPGQPEPTAPVFESRTIRTMLFRVGGAAAPATAGAGFLIDDLDMSSDSPVVWPVPSLAPCVGVVDGTTYRLTADCVTDHTLRIPDGWTLDGDGFSITAVDPAGDHFRGAIVRNDGAVAHVVDLTVTASGLANVCDEGDDRLRGILFDGASGSVTNSVVTDVNQGPSGCQEGNGIEVRNAPFDKTGSDLWVLVSGNTVDGYIKTGIIANGSVAATITDNVVTGAGHVGVPLAAQNGIQVGFGATAIVSGNTVRDNYYVPNDWVACGLLFFEADGVRAQRNDFSGNEKNQCNVGKSGGRFNPQS